MATTEQFSLRWNNFHSNITTGFHDLLQANDMVDVTLAVDGQFLQAHKIVLSICSPFFKLLFKVNPCKHPVIILRDVTYGNLKDILEFMYLGEVNILRDNLSMFLKTAELLQVKGLTGDDSSETSSKQGDKSDSVCDDFEQDIQQFIEPKSPIMPLPLTMSPAAVPLIPICNMKRPKHSFNNNKRSKPDIKNTKSSDDDYEFTDPDLKAENVDDNCTNNNEIIKQLLENSLPGPDMIAQDGKIEEKIATHPYKCEKCIKRFSRRDHLRTHEKNIHGEDAGPFACYICAQLYKNAESLRKHIAKFHCHKIESNQKVVTDNHY